MCVSRNKQCLWSHMLDTKNKTESATGFKFMTYHSSVRSFDHWATASALLVLTRPFTCGIFCCSEFGTLAASLSIEFIMVLTSFLCSSKYLQQNVCVVIFFSTLVDYKYSFSSGKVERANAHKIREKKRDAEEGQNYPFPTALHHQFWPCTTILALHHHI